MLQCCLLTQTGLLDKADSRSVQGFQGSALPNRSARVLWNLKKVSGAHQSEVLGLVLPSMTTLDLRIAELLPVGVKFSLIDGTTEFVSGV